MKRNTKTIYFLPCPFCGAEPVMQPWHGGGPNKVHVGCQNDECPISPGVCGETPSEARDDWNTRDD